MKPHPLVPPPTGRLGLLEFVEPLVCAAVAKRLEILDEALAPHVTFDGDLAADPLEVLEIVIALERRLAIAVAEAEIDRVRTIADLVHLVTTSLWERDHEVAFTPHARGVAA